MIVTTSGISALYMDNQYQFIRLKDEGVYCVLNNDERDIVNGFELVPDTDDRYCRDIVLMDLDFVFLKDRDVIYKGDRFYVTWIKHGIVEICSSDPELGHKYNMKLYDRYDYSLEVDLAGLDQFTEKWTPVVKYLVRKEKTTYTEEAAHRRIILTQGKMALYRSCQYELSIPENSDQFGLLSNDPKDLEWGFSKTLDNEKIFRKDVTLQELDWVFEQETTVKYKGDEFTADHIVGKYIMLQTNDQGLSVKHKMEEWKHGEFRLPVDMKDVEEIVIKWTPLREYYSYK